MPERDWWQFRGPSRFTDLVADDLRAGRNVVVLLPDHAPDGLAAALRGTLRGALDWHTVDLAPARARGEPLNDPARWLFRRFGLPHDPTDVPDADALADAPGAAGWLLWTEGHAAPDWHDWKSFLERYQQAARRRQHTQRPQFCVVLRGAMALCPPPPDAGLVLRPWYGVVEPLDMLAYASRRLEGQSLPGLLRGLTAAVVAGLAQWDTATCEALARSGLDTLCDPARALARVAAERGWKADDAPSWHLGTADWYDGQHRSHSALLAAAPGHKGRARVLDRRVWSAHLAVVLPFVEEYRRQLIDRFRAVLTVPFVTDRGESIDDADDLEIGHVRYLLRLDQNRTRVPADVRRSVDLLWRARNELAHGNPLAADLFGDRAFGLLAARPAPPASWPPAPPDDGS